MLFSLKDESFTVGSETVASSAVIGILHPKKFLNIAGSPKIIFFLDNVNILFLFVLWNVGCKVIYI